MPTQNLLGLKIDTLSLAQTVELICERCQEEQGTLLQVVTLNPEMVVRAQKEPKLAKIINSAGLVVPDGVGVVWGLQQLGSPARVRVPGIELVQSLLDSGPGLLGRELKIFLLGASPEVVKEAARVIERDYPRARVVGFHDGYFTPAEEGEIVDQINQGQPDILLVGLGSPYQELWVDYHRQELAIKVAIGVGGSLDVLAGKVRRAPEIWRRLGLEWLYRLLKNPRRFPRILALPKFVMLVLKEKAFLRS